MSPIASGEHPLVSVTSDVVCRRVDHTCQTVDAVLARLAAMDRDADAQRTQRTQRIPAGR